MLKEWIAKGKPYYLLVLKVGDLYFLPKGVGHFFLTLHGTTHSVIGMQTVLKRPPPADVSTVTRVQFAELRDAVRRAVARQGAIAPLFEVKAPSPNGDGLYVKDASQARVTLPVFGEAMLLGDARLTPDFISAHQGRLLKTPWFVNAVEAEMVSSECPRRSFYNPPPPLPLATDVIACVSTTYCSPALCSTGAQASFGTRFGEGDRFHRALSPPVCR